MNANIVLKRDALEVMKEMDNEVIDLVYIDADYNVGINYAGKKYTKAWKDYIDWYVTLCKEAMRILKPNGNLFTINYPKQNAYLRVKWLDDNAFTVRDYVWVYNCNIGVSKRYFTTAHRSILHATKSKNNQFFKEQVAVPYQNENDKRIQSLISGGSKGRMPYSWFYFNLVKNVSKEKTSHACQIPSALSEMIIKSCTRDGDLVFIPFGGSGSEIVKCKELKRGYIACEIHEEYFNLIQSRLM